MTKETLVFFCGILLMIVPFLGIPELWRYGVTAFLGAVLILTGYGLRRSQYLKHIDRGNGERGNDSFVETTEKLFDEGALK